jgi:hypothetical protein
MFYLCGYGKISQPQNSKANVTQMKWSKNVKIEEQQHERKSVI